MASFAISSAWATFRCWLAVLPAARAKACEGERCDEQENQRGGDRPPLAGGPGGGVLAGGHEVTLGGGERRVAGRACCPARGGLTGGGQLGSAVKEGRIVVVIAPGRCSSRPLAAGPEPRSTERADC